MFDDPRERFVLQEVGTRSQAFREEERAIGIEDVRKFPAAASALAQEMNLAVHAYLEQEYPRQENQGRYLCHLIPHTYHMLQIQKKIDLIRGLLPRLEYMHEAALRIVNANELELFPGITVVPDRMLVYRIIGAMCFVRGEFAAMERLMV